MIRKTVRTAASDRVQQDLAEHTLGRHFWSDTPPYITLWHHGAFHCTSWNFGILAWVRKAGTSRAQAFLPIQKIQSLAIAGPARFPIDAAQASSNSWGHHVMAAQLTEDAPTLSARIIDDTADIFPEDKMLAFAGQHTGETAFYDDRGSWCANPRSLMRCVNFHGGPRSLNASLNAGSACEIHASKYEPGIAIRDDTLMDLAQKLPPAFKLTDQTNRLFMSHVNRAFASHLAMRYGGAQAQGTIRGGLAPWQQQRALDMISANLTGDLSIEDLANECGLSAGHFSRAFKKSLGTTPYRRLQEERIEKAKDLLAHSSLATAQIATACGFVDQSHLTRVFSQMCGEPPAAWRRNRRSAYLTIKIPNA